jgi:hypothetical protein
MKRTLIIGLAALFLAGCGGGGSMSVPSGTGTAPSQAKSQVRAPRTTKTYNYTLSIPAYPSGFNPPCQEVNPTIWTLNGGGSAVDVTNGNSNQAGGVPPSINIGPSCGLAHNGDSIHVQMDVSYGNPNFVAGSGNFKVDSTDDSSAFLTITDNTTGVSTNVTVYISY